MIDHPIVDSHVHLLNPDLLSYGWTDGAPVLNRTVLPEHLTAAASPYEVEQFVFVEADVDHPQYLKEADWVAGLAESDPRLAGIVACLPLEQGSGIEADLERLCQHKIVKSVRRLIQNQADPDFCIKPDFLAGLKLLADRDIAFDICILHHQMPATIEMVRRSPNVRFVLDHIGKPGIKAGLFDPWRDHMRDLAAMDNVHCKISGVATEADHNDWTREQIRPYIEHTVECFGFDRCMFGSDWHVLELAGNYPDWLEIMDWIFVDASADERNRLFRENTKNFYRLGA